MSEWIFSCHFQKYRFNNCPCQLRKHACQSKTNLCTDQDFPQKVLSSVLQKRFMLGYDFWLMSPRRRFASTNHPLRKWSPFSPHPAPTPPPRVPCWIGDLTKRVELSHVTETLLRQEPAALVAHEWAVMCTPEQFHIFSIQNEHLAA